MIDLLRGHRGYCCKCPDLEKNSLEDSSADEFGDSTTNFVELAMCHIESRAYVAGAQRRR